MYADGDGVTRDDQRAFEYFQDIADAHADDSPGTPQARFVANAFVALGRYYLDGIPNSPVKADPDRAREMFAYAASYFGDPDAQYHLGRMYLDGRAARATSARRRAGCGSRPTRGSRRPRRCSAHAVQGRGVPRQAARGLMWLTLARDAGAAGKRITDLHAAASQQATDDQRALALIFLERWLKGRRD